MIGYEKRDQRGFLTEFLAWSDSIMCAESWCKFHIKILIISGVKTIFTHSGGYTFLSINLYGRAFWDLYTSATVTLMNY